MGAAAGAAVAGFVGDGVAGDGVGPTVAGAAVEPTVDEPAGTGAGPAAGGADRAVAVAAPAVAGGCGGRAVRGRSPEGRVGSRVSRTRQHRGRRRVDNGRRRRIDHRGHGDWVGRSSGLAADLGCRTDHHGGQRQTRHQRRSDQDDRSPVDDTLGERRVPLNLRVHACNTTLGGIRVGELTKSLQSGDEPWRQPMTSTPQAEYLTLRREQTTD